jgi:Domain of unknown function (DUF4116)
MSDLRSRLRKILDLHGQAIFEAIRHREPMSAEANLQLEASCRSDRDLVLRFAGSDPTPGKSRTQWLIKTYIQDSKFKLEDLGRAHAALAAFERFKPKLSIEQREINHLKTMFALEALVDPFVKAEERARLTRDLSSATGREKRRLEELKARDESIILQESDGLPTIAVPMTEFAAQWWGRGTKWCTAADKNNAFAQYHEFAPLVIIVCPDGAKFQLYVKKNDAQFMDNMDTTVDKKIIQERWNEFQSLLYWAVEKNGWALKYVPMDKRKLELCRLAIQQNGQALQLVPKDKRTPALCRIAVEQNGKALIWVPIKHMTPTLCRIAIEQNGYVLEDVPENDRTPELCRIAVEQNELALEYVPSKHQTPELCRLAVEQNGRALKYVSEITPELCRLAVEQDGESLYYVPEKYKTLEICRLAVEQNSLAFKSSPEEYKSELYYLAVQQDGNILRHVPIGQRTLELCRLAVEQNGRALQWVHDQHKTSEVFRIAVEQDGYALYYVPDSKRTHELCRIAVENNGQALYAVHEKHRTPELCSLAVQQNGQALSNRGENDKPPKFLALISPVQPKWHPDILQGLGYQPQALQDFQSKHQFDNILFSPAY